MGRGRGNTAATQALDQRTTFSTRWDEIARNIQRRKDDARRERERADAPGSDKQIARLLRALRDAGQSAEKSRCVGALTEELVAFLRAEHPRLGDMWKLLLLPVPASSSAQEHLIWTDVADEVRGGMVPLLSQDRHTPWDINDTGTEVATLKDLARGALMRRCLRHTPKQMAVDMTVVGSPARKHLALQLPGFTKSRALNETSRQLGYHGLADALGTLSEAQWEGVYANITGDVAWMQPEGELTFLGRYRARFSAVLLDALRDGTVQPKS